METKRVKVIMLPTKDKTYIAIMRTGNKLMYIDRPKSLNNGHQHLYFISDEEIKKGDWYYNSVTKEIKQRNYLDVIIISDGDIISKIIATTDKLLLSKGCDMCDNTGQIVSSTTCTGFKSCECIKYVPSPSQSFIKKYCELGGIDEVLIKYSTWVADDEDSIIHQSMLKINSHNEIAILSIKNSWTKEEMIEAWAAGYESCENGEYHNLAKIEWTEKNL